MKEYSDKAIGVIGRATEVFVANSFSASRLTLRELIKATNNFTSTPIMLSGIETNINYVLKPDRWSDAISCQWEIVKGDHNLTKITLAATPSSGEYSFSINEKGVVIVNSDNKPTTYQQYEWLSILYMQARINNLMTGDKTGEIRLFDYCEENEKKEPTLKPKARHLGRHGNLNSLIQDWLLEAGLYPVSESDNNANSNDCTFNLDLNKDNDRKDGVLHTGKVTVTWKNSHIIDLDRINHVVYVDCDRNNIVKDLISLDQMNNTVICLKQSPPLLNDERLNPTLAKNGSCRYDVTAFQSDTPEAIEEFILELLRNNNEFKQHQAIHYQHIINLMNTGSGLTPTTPSGVPINSVNPLLTNASLGSYILNHFEALVGDPALSPYDPFSEIPGAYFSWLKSGDEILVTLHDSKAKALRHFFGSYNDANSNKGQLNPLSQSESNDFDWISITDGGTSNFLLKAIIAQYEFLGSTAGVVTQQELSLKLIHSSS